jgi:hypothetical protein
MTQKPLCLDFPMRPDFLAQIVVPRDMTKREAERLSAMIVTLSIADSNPEPVVPAPPWTAEGMKPWAQACADFRRDYFISVLNRAKGCARTASRLAGMNRTSFLKAVASLGIYKPNPARENKGKWDRKLYADK